MIKIYNRASGLYDTEVAYGEKQLTFLYHTVLGRLLLKLISNRSFSRLNAVYYNSPRSQTRIEPFIKKYNIQMHDFEKKDYLCFNDFFTRRLSQGKRPICLDPKRLIAPADSKLTIYPITSTLKIPVKNAVYSMSELIKDDALAAEFENGLCLVYRLTVDDYHRYCYIDDGEIIGHKKINGRLHTVSSLSRDYKVYSENLREYQVVASKRLGKLIQMEVGALLVGQIVNAPSQQAMRGAEKGYFSYGGSTIIVLIKANRVAMDPDIFKHSLAYIETRVKYGEAVGAVT